MNYLINPHDVINYNRTDDELELFWLFCCVVAGKTASTQARGLNNFMNSLDERFASPFAKIKQAISDDILLSKLIDSRLGQFNRLVVTFEQSLRLDLRNCGVVDLENIHGVGPKTARMFLMMSRPDQRYAALDTHLLKHLRENNIDAPLATPSGSRYRALENEFLKLVDKSGMTVAEYDLMIWKSYAVRT